MDKVLFPLTADGRYRLASDPLQWIIQRKRGESERYEAVSFHRQKASLLAYFKEHKISLNPNALSLLSELPDWK